MKKNIKDALQALYWEKSPCGDSFYFTVTYGDGFIHGILELMGGSDGQETAPECWEHLNRISKELCQWDEKARLLLNRKFPDEDVDELGLRDVEISADGSFRLGYDAGDTPSGGLCLYVNFKKNFIPDDTIVYETV